MLIMCHSTEKGKEYNCCGVSSTSSKKEWFRQLLVKGRIVMSVLHSKPGRFKTFVSLMLCTILASIAVLALSSTVSADPLGALIVSGTVYDSGGFPLEGAHVVVTDTRTLVSDYFDSLSGGFYVVSLPGGGGWDIGDIIDVVATAPGEDQKTVSSEVPADAETNGMTIDVYFGTAIPQLGSSVGMAIAAGLVGLIAVVAVGVRRR
jgi:hypothetical protein